MPRQKRLKRIKLLQWKQFLKDNDLNFIKFSRLVFPMGVPLPKRIARPKERVMIEDEANIENY